MRVEIENYERLSELLGERIDKVSLHNHQGMSVEILTYGCLMIGLNVPDASGYAENVVMTYSEAKDYLRNPIYMNVTVGPNAGRMKHGAFNIGNASYQTDINDGISNLHGGAKGFHKRIWTLCNEDIYADRCEVTLKLTHEHDEDGFPGNIDVEAKYTLFEDNTLQITFSGMSDRDCHLNMANHNYFNLSGNEKRKIDEHLLFLNAMFYKETDKYGVPVEAKIQLKNSKFDFTQLVPISNAYQAPSKGIDHPFSLEDKLDVLAPDVIYMDPISGRVLEIKTNQPCVVVYTNNLDFKNHGGICFETQMFPNQVNLLEAGIRYFHETTYKFTCKK